MKINFLITIIGFLFLTVCSCKSRQQKEAEDYRNKIEKTMKENSPENTGDEPKAVAANIPAGMENVLGEWKLAKRLRDDNGNHVIDAEEQNSEIKSNNYMKFNADGTCKFEELMDGKYEIITGEEGRKKISIYDITGTAYPYELYVLSVTRDELVINRILGGGSQFDIYKRP